MSLSTTGIYATLKAAMKSAGHAVSEGEQWLATDAAHFRDYCHFTLGVAEHVAHEIIAFPDTVRTHLGHWFNEVGDFVAPGSAPVVAAPIGGDGPTPQSTIGGDGPSPKAQTPAQPAMVPAIDPQVVATPARVPAIDPQAAPTPDRVPAIDPQATNTPVEQSMNVTPTDKPAAPAA